MDRLRVRFLVAMGLPLVGCQHEPNPRDPAVPVAVNEPQPSAASSSSMANASPTPIANATPTSNTTSTSNTNTNPTSTSTSNPNPTSTSTSTSNPNSNPNPNPNPNPNAALDAGIADAARAQLPRSCSETTTPARAFPGSPVAGCAASVSTFCCGPAGGVVKCDAPLDAVTTKRLRATTSFKAACCYQNHEPDVCEGRPYRIAEERIVASTKARDDWRAEVGAIAVAANERESLLRTWERIACDEHASIAAFSVASLELMALGAPASLVEAVHRAALDEVEHARLAFAIARSLGGAPIGPSSLPMPRALSASFDSVVTSTFEDACIGETLAALRARDDAERATDETIRAALHRIADDEERHAELGWRILAWAVHEGGTRARDALAAAIGRASSSANAARPAFARAILPCAHALLDSVSIKEGNVVQKSTTAGSSDGQT